MKRVLLGLGSNKSFNNKSPLELLAAAGGELGLLMSDIHCSSVYKPPATYVTDQEDGNRAAPLGIVPDDADAFHLFQKMLLKWEKLHKYL